MKRNALMDGRLVDGRLVDGRLVDGRLVDGRLVDGRLLGGRLSWQPQKQKQTVAVSERWQRTRVRQGE